MQQGVLVTQRGADSFHLAPCPLTADKLTKNAAAVGPEH